MRNPGYLLCGAALLFGAPAQAGDCVEPAATRVQLEARAAAEIDNDSMRATLFTEIEEADAARAAERVNRATRDSVDALKRYPGLRVRTGSYSAFPVTDRGRLVRWRARAEVVIEGEDFASVSEAIGRVQARMQLAGVEFFVSAARRRQVEAELTQAAIAEFLDKAGLVAEGFKGSGFQVADAVVAGDGGAPPPQPLMMRSTAAEAAAPPLEGGTSRIAVNVSGTVLIQR